MKNSLVIVLGLFSVCLTVEAAWETVAFPTLRARPILAVMPRHDSIGREAINLCVNATCRLLGYHSAAYNTMTDSSISSCRYVMRPGTEVFDPLAVVDPRTLPDKSTVRIQDSAQRLALWPEDPDEKPYV